MGKTTKYISFKNTARNCLAVTTLGFATLLPTSSHALDLRHHSVVTDQNIKLGDIFSGLTGSSLEHKAERVLGVAPRPGDQMVLNARTLMRIAIALDLPWRPVSAADQVVLSRAATVIDDATVKDAIKQSLYEAGLDGNFDLVIPHQINEIILPHQYPRTLEVINIDYHPERGHFEAEIAAPSASNPVQKQVIFGSIEKMIRVPTLRTNFRNGTIIGIRDIDMIEIPQSRVRHNVILDPKELVGMTPRRVIFEDKPIKIEDIEAPRIVKRGENVTMVFKEGPLVLTAQGKALEFGAKGDAIRVTNLTSSRTVEAIVTGEKEVSVSVF
ncbi:MAG: flagella basal body P-ring formation protein FlgA [Micavibrio sp. TMED27]|nr:flagella basal body P-ring formation protein FlgA [Micavibrio sp.]OUT89694.1 MAG: flagella basal body P-ring formation protein FlgA [Micavibrio sp. TMED27]|tara:strand:- start:249 stop:1229 length:981 start_codon:yes stop_codon:yes gene_type:complete